MSLNGDQNPQSETKTRKAIKYGITAILGGILTTIVAAIVGVITSAYVEISFKEAPKSWDEWMDLHVDVVQTKPFRSYYGDNDNGKTVLADSTVSLRFFRLSKKILGTDTTQKSKYAINGFYKDELIVFSERGEHGGQAVQILKLFPTSTVTGTVYAGYALQEDWKFEGASPDWIIKCPYLMVEEGTAKGRYSDRAAILTDFPFLSSKCVEFRMPASLTKAVVEGQSVDELLEKLR